MIRVATYLPLAVAAILAVVFFWALSGDRDPSRVPSPFIDKPAPALDLAALDGGPRLTAAAFAGRVSILNVFASWCLPCLAEHPFLMALAKDGRAQIFGLNYKDKPEDAKAWLAKHGNPYTRIGTDRNGRAGIEWGVYGVPETFLIGPDGQIRHKVVGPITNDQLKQLRRMIAELGK